MLSAEETNNAAVFKHINFGVWLGKFFLLYNFHTFCRFYISCSGWWYSWSTIFFLRWKSFFITFSSKRNFDITWLIDGWRYIDSFPVCFAAEGSIFDLLWPLTLIDRNLDCDDSHSPHFNETDFTSGVPAIVPYFITFLNFFPSVEAIPLTYPCSCHA